MSGEFSESTERRYSKPTIASEMYCPECEGSFSAFDEVCPRDGTRLVRLTGGGDGLEGTNLDGRFTLLKKLGSGGMGSVYLARQHTVRRDVAIKVIRPELSSQIVAAKRFLREARLASRLNHPHMVSVLEFGQSPGGLLFLVMELLRGRTIAELLHREGRLPIRRAVGICLQLCDALQVAHGADVVHRDLKPANIIMLHDPPGRDFIKVLDFGLAKSLAGDNTTTQSGQLMGTPAYMAPEAILEGTLDLRSDLYALGVILYEMLDGEPPFSGDNINALVMQQAYTEPPPFRHAVPQPLERVVFRLLEKQVGDRYQSAAEVRAALLAATDESAAVSSAWDASDRGAHSDDSMNLDVSGLRRPRRRAMPLVVLAVLALAAGAIVLGRDWLRRSSGPAAPRTQPVRPVSAAASGAAPSSAGALVAPDAQAAGAARSKPSPAQSSTRPTGPRAAAAKPLPPDTTVPARVTIVLRARPRAQVAVDGRPRGRTPKSIELPRSAAPVKVEFSRAGRRSARREIRPDHDQTVSVFLPRARSRRAFHPPRRSHRHNPPPKPRKHERAHESKGLPF